MHEQQQPPHLRAVNTLKMSVADAVAWLSSPAPRAQPPASSGTF